MSVSYGSTAIIAEQQTSGTEGGAFTSGARRTRTLNTEVYDPDGIVTLSSNQFTLQAGTYEIEAIAPAFWVSRNKAWIHNVTDSVDIATSNSNFASSSFVSRMARMRAIVSIGTTTAFDIQHQCETSRAINGLGVASFFDTEQYTTVVIRELVSVGDAPITAILADQKTSGTNGQSVTIGAWRTRDLNTEVYDPDGIVTLSSNQFTLQAGTYEIEASSQINSANRTHSRLYNVTDSSSEFVGLSMYVDGAGGQAPTTLIGVVTLASAKTFEVQQRPTTAATGGFASSLDVEQYTTVKIRKIA